ncbi:helicase [Vibrio lentus]|uniref:DEAD/DEAH box helicase n=1 Tax=Vibrio lentus TaxID=136468 RepID=UPI000CAF663D|nr:helicase C-terminal domain-containing protein [Vibrio lentus]PMN48395.1 helicase [Vibrio lentus]
MLDLSALQKGNPVNDSHIPRDIFQALPKQPGKFQYPRDVQADVWDKWHTARNNRDSIIKMNTGSGKTVVGLLILKSCLNEKSGPCIYVVPDNYLISQVVQEATSLGINITQDENDPQFLSGNSILVANIYKLFNGMSVFGVGSDIKKEIGSVLIDDAHACLDTVNDQFTIKIPRGSDLYNDLGNLFADSLRQQNEVKFEEIVASEPNAFLQVPFWSWKSQLSEVTKLLVKNKSEQYLKFSYPLLNQSLALSHCVMGSQYIEISPYSIPTDMIPSYSKAKRRIFMTATLADNGVLATHFGVNKESLSNQITPKSAGDVGERMILFPQVINSKITDDEIKECCVKLAKEQNVVVVVPSFYRANYWRDVSDKVLDSDSMALGVAELKQKHVGLVILINRYDGIDLPQNACRVLVIDSLPNTSSLIGKVNQSLLLSNEWLVTDYVQKVEQGMGRGIRSNDDYCVVVLMGKQLTNALYSHTGINSFSPATRAQIALSDSIAQQLAGKDMSQIREAMNYCLERNSEWVSACQSHISNLPYEEPKIGLNVELNEAFKLAQMHDFPSSAQKIQELINQYNDNTIQGYLKQVLATYTNNFNEVDAQKILLGACKLNQRLLKPLNGFNYQKLNKRARTQAEECLLYVNGFNEKGAFLLALNSVLADLQFMPNSANRFEAALHTLGLILGFGSQRPENDYKMGPDNLWCLGDNNYLVIECKNEAVVPTVTKTYCNQLNGSGHWFDNNYHGMTHTLLLIHPSNLFEAAASPASNMKVMTENELNRLTNNVRTMFEGLVQQGNTFDAETIRQNLIHYKLDSGNFINEYTTIVKKGK